MTVSLTNSGIVLALQFRVKGKMMAGKNDRHAASGGLGGLWRQGLNLAKFSPVLEAGSGIKD
jgi:hypothetical protein